MISNSQRALKINSNNTKQSFETGRLLEWFAVFFNPVPVMVSKSGSNGVGLLEWLAVKFDSGPVVVSKSGTNGVLE